MEFGHRSVLPKLFQSKANFVSHIPQVQLQNVSFFLITIFCKIDWKRSLSFRHGLYFLIIIALISLKVLVTFYEII